MARERLQIVSGTAAGQSINVTGDFMIGRGETGMGNLAGDSEIELGTNPIALAGRG